MPTVEELAEVEVNDDNATMEARLTDNGGMSITECGFCWDSSSAEPDITRHKKAVATLKDGVFQAKLTGLTYNTSYHVRAYAVNGKGVGYSAYVIIKTRSSAKATIVNMTARNPSPSTHIFHTYLLGIPHRPDRIELQTFCYGTFQNENGTDRPESQDKAKRGYARLGYGNYGNLDARANYLFILPNSDKLNLNFHMNGMDGKLDLPDSKDKWDARYYRTHAGMDYVHAFRKMDLNVAGNFGLSNFNFMPGSTNNKQKFLSGDVHFGIKSTSEELPLQFHAETNLMFYERQHDIQYQDAQEVMVRTKAGAMGTISELS